MKPIGLVRCSKWKECKKLNKFAGHCIHLKPHQDRVDCWGNPVRESKCDATGFIVQCLPIPVVKQKKQKKIKDYCEWRKSEDCTDLYIIKCCGYIPKLDKIMRGELNTGKIKYCLYCGKKIKLRREEKQCIG